MDHPVDEGFYSATSNSTAFTTNDRPTTCEQVYEELGGQLKGKIYADVPAFFETLFDIDVPAADILKDATAKGLYAKSGFWKNLGTPPRVEDSLYGPFVAAANFIAKSAVRRGQDNGLAIHWLTTSDRAPKKADRLSARGRPDILGVRNGKQLQKAAKAKNKSDQSAARSHPSWYDTVIPVEVKRYEEDTSAIRQLCNYIRQIFHEAIDRRFVFGLVLAGHYLTVWLADRSGLIGSKAFNINKEPEQFIRVIAAISTYPQVRLGFDDALQRYTPKESDFFADIPRARWADESKEERYADEECHLPPPESSHQLQEDLSDSESIDERPQTKPRAKENVGQEEIRWRVEIEGIAFILWRPLSILRGESIQGRATRIWRAWKEDEMSKPLAERTKYVVKDAWRDTRRGLEGDFYREIGPCEGVAECVASATCTIDGVEDDTLNSIRRGLIASSPPINFNASQRAQNEKVADHDENRREARDPDDPTLKSSYLDFLPPYDSMPQTTYRPRVHSRLVLKTYGWLIKSSLSRLELVGAFRDAVAGHEHALQKGVLHRDISVGNILITGDKTKGKRGVLIDFENAKRMRDKEPLLDDPLSFTYPFCSGEIINGQPYYPPSGVLPHEVRAPARAPVHDLESFFWVLCYICLTRVGPNKRRPILDKVNVENPTHRYLRNQVYKLFDGDPCLIATAKQLIFTSLSKIGFEIGGYISPYWKPLWPLVERLYGCLYHAYLNGAYDDLHEKFLAAFDECETTLLRDAQDGKIAAMLGIAKYQERERRRRDRDDKKWTWQLSPRRPKPWQTLKQDTSARDTDPQDMDVQDTGALDVDAEDTDAPEGQAVVADAHARSESPSERPAKRRRTVAASTNAVDPSSAGPSTSTTT